MKKILVAAGLLIIGCVCHAQATSPQEVQSISNYFYHQGYTYLQAGHLSCDVKKIGVYFPDPATNSNEFSVGVSYKDLFSQEFTCFYTFTYGNGYFTNMKWECHSPDVKCFRFCNGLLDELWAAYRRNHPGNNPNDTVDGLKQRIADMFRKSIESITCNEYVLGFLIIDYMGQ